MIKKRLVHLLEDSRKYIFRNVFWQWCGLLFQILAVSAMGILLENLVQGEVSARLLAGTALVCVCSILVRFFCEKKSAEASFMASVDVKRILREKIYDKLTRLGSSYREKISTSEVVQLSAEGVEQLETYFGRYLPQFFYSLLAPLTLFAVLSFVNLKASVILLVCVPLIPVSIVAVQKFAKKLLNKYWGSYTELGDSFLENLQGLTTLKIYQSDEKKAEEMDKEAEQFRRITMKVLTMQLNSISVMDLVACSGGDDCNCEGISGGKSGICRSLYYHPSGFGIFYSSSSAGLFFPRCYERNGSQRQNFPSVRYAGGRSRQGRTAGRLPGYFL